MSESRATQFIMVEFPFIDSQLYDDWDARGLKLYIKMRRYVCRSNDHRLAGYWQSGYLATEGFQGQWASFLGCSQPTVSKLLRWMEEKGVIVCAHKSQTSGDPNVYVLGRVMHVEGSEKQVEVFFLDHHHQAQTKGSFPETDTDGLPPVVASDVHEIDVPVKMRTHSLQNDTYSPGNGTYSVENRTYSPGNRSNIEDRIVEDRIDIPPSAEISPKEPTPVQEPTAFEKERRAAGMAALARSLTRAPEDNWAAPPQAGGADDYDVALEAFCEVTGDISAEITGKERKQWLAALRRAGDARSARPSEVAAAICGKPQSELAWKTWVNPHQAEDDIKLLVGQYKNGGIKREGKRRGLTALDRLIERERGVTIDVEYSFAGEVL